MAIDYAYAIRIAREKYEPGWSIGTFWIDEDTVTETDRYFVIKMGAREFMIDGDLDYAITRSPIVVYKDSGEIGTLAYDELEGDPTLVTHSRDATGGL